MISTTAFSPALLLLLSKAFLISVVKGQAVATASIENTIEYLEQVNCVRNCIWNPGASDDVRDFIGCGSPWLNGCICNPSSSSSISSFLSTCVMASCSSATSNVRNAISVYSVYCVEGGTVLTVTSDNEASSPTSTMGKLMAILREGS
jgi:hypothetical protein